MAVECSSCYEPIRGSGGLCYYCQCLTSDDLMTYLRGAIKRWVMDSKRHWGGRCVVTGQPSEVVHHLTNFADLVTDALDELRLPRKPVSWYEANERQDLTLLVLMKHYEAGLGVCLTRALHDEYHARYGKRNNTPDQFNAWYHERTGKLWTGRR